MSSHLSDPVVADLIRHARVGAAANPYPPRTRSLGEHSARQHSVGSLIVETARADAGVSEEVAQARREVIAAELGRRRMVQAAEEARRQAELDRSQAEQERDEAVRRARERSGPDPDFLTLAVIAAVTLEITEYELAGVLDAAITDIPGLSAADTADLAGERRVGLTEELLHTEVAAVGGSPIVADVIDTGVGTQTPSQLITQSEQEAQPAAATFDSAAASVDTAPEVEEL
ncbi:hypothetical protein [Dietzia maris]|uniref:hypothetical protein n=1 Tax=Dietzia maris TaxID=37915 RepID=UPI00232C82FD|nr:hypothetical protein [Dietzia maris]